MIPIQLPVNYNYIGVFLTFACSLRCPYCLNLHGRDGKGFPKSRTHMSPEEWISAFDRIEPRADVPITLQGGEPMMYRHLPEVVNGTRPDHKFDLLTNLEFDVEGFIRSVNREKFLREAPYGPIRVSYHPGQNHIEDLIQKTLRLMEAGFRVGIYGILHPSIVDHILETKDHCLSLGIDFRTKEFLGVEDGVVYGEYKYKDSINGTNSRHCECRNSELLISPSGDVHRCHYYLYNNLSPIGHILDPSFQIDQRLLPCSFYGHCNPCDVKVKTNRFQIFGHTSVTIQNIRELSLQEQTRSL